MNAHELVLTRYNRGRRAWGDLRGAAGLEYGTAGRCRCGFWSDRVNVAPSRGGRKVIEARFAEHVARQQA